MLVIDAVRELCSLQPLYSAANTPEMQRRHYLLSKEVLPWVGGHIAEIQAAMGITARDMAVEARDGTGLKTELPWLRIYSKALSPSATIGFYIVLHFATDGSAVFVTLGCGSSRLSGGSYVLLPNAQLDSRTEWAREVVIEADGSLGPFVDEPLYGATRPLPVSFQRATALCKRVPIAALTEEVLQGLIIQAVARLRHIYEAQAQGRESTPADLSESEISEVLKPLGRRGQGIGLTVAQRKAVELRAMEIAEQHLSEIGYAVTDVSAFEPFDLAASKEGEHIKVEVKGTTSDFPSDILMTRNEVELHRREVGSTALALVSAIRLNELAGSWSATGGKLEYLHPWRIDEWELEPTAFRVRRTLGG